MTIEKQHPSTHAEGKMEVSSEQWEAGVGRAVRYSAPGKSCGAWKCNYSQYVRNAVDDDTVDDLAVATVWEADEDGDPEVFILWCIKGDHYRVEWGADEPNMDVVLEVIGVKPETQTP